MESLEQRLKARRIIDKKTGCWIWTGPKRHGYGRLSYKNKDRLVHRLSAYLWNGFALDSKLFICHICDNTQCFNPMHLFPGTASDNAKDAIMKNRAYKFKIRPRAKNQSTTLTDWDVEEIIYRHLNTATTKKALAQEHNVSDTMVARAISGIFWKHVQRGRIMIKVEINGDFRLAKDQSGKLKGFCDINLGENLMIIRNVRLIEGRNGLFAAMPAKYTEAKEGEDRGKYYSYIFFPNDEGSERSSLHQKITEAMTVAWREKAKESGGGAAGVKGKGSLTDMLGKGQG